jgi:hypothetical protein
MMDEPIPAVIDSSLSKTREAPFSDASNPLAGWSRRKRDPRK